MDAKERARLASDVQNACNPVPVARIAGEIALAILNDSSSTDAVRRDPAFVAVVDKLASLCDLQGDQGIDRAMDAHGAVRRILED